MLVYAEYALKLIDSPSFTVNEQLKFPVYPNDPVLVRV